MAAVWGAAAITFVLATGFLPKWILALTTLVWSVLFAALVIAAALPKFKRPVGRSEKGLSSSEIA